MLIRQIRSLGSSRKKIGEQADFNIGSLRLLQDTHLIFRGSNFSPERQGGLSFLYCNKGVHSSGSIQRDKGRTTIGGYIEGELHQDQQTFKGKIDLSDQGFGPSFLEPLSS